MAKKNNKMNPVPVPVFLAAAFPFKLLTKVSVAYHRGTISWLKHSLIVLFRETNENCFCEHFHLLSVKTYGLITRENSVFGKINISYILIRELTENAIWSWFSNITGVDRVIFTCDVCLHTRIVNKCCPDLCAFILWRNTNRNPATTLQKKIWQNQTVLCLSTFIHDSCSLGGRHICFEMSYSSKQREDLLNLQQLKPWNTEDNLVWSVTAFYWSICSSKTKIMMMYCSFHRNILSFVVVLVQFVFISCKCRINLPLNVLLSENSRQKKLLSLKFSTSSNPCNINRAPIEPCVCSCLTLSWASSGGYDSKNVVFTEIK